MPRTNHSTQKRIPGEEVYSDVDTENDVYGVYGVDSGFCYGTYCSEDEARTSASERNNRTKK